MHCSAIWLLSVILKKIKSFIERPMYFSSTKILNFWTFRENLLIQLHSTANFLHLAVFKNLKIFLRITILFSKSQFLNMLRNITNSVAFYCKFAIFISFLKNRIFLFGKTHPFFYEKHQFFECFENFFFQWPCSATLLLLPILGKARISWKYQSLFFQKKQKLWTFWEILPIQLHSASNWLMLLAVSEKTQDFFSQKPIFFSRRKQFFNVLRGLTFSVASNNKTFNFWRFLQNQSFFSKNPYFFFTITKFWRLREVLLFQCHFTASLLHLAIFLKNRIFFSKNPPYFSSKNINFEGFENFFKFSCFSQQFCYIYCFLQQNSYFPRNHLFFLQQKT